MGMHPTALTRALPADLPAIVALMNAAYRGVGPAAGWNSEAGYIEGDRTSELLLGAEIDANPHAFLLVVRDQATASIHGCVWLQPLSAGTWYLGSLTVAPPLQNSGLGRTMLDAAERWAADHGARTVEIKVVNVRDTLIAWYGRRGYRLTGETHPFPYGDTRFGTPLRDDLTFVVLEKALPIPAGPGA